MAAPQPGHGAGQFGPRPPGVPPVPPPPGVAPPYPQQVPGAPYPQQPGYPQQQGYPQQPGYPQQQSYPQQPGYPQQQPYPQSPGGAMPPGVPQWGAPQMPGAPQYPVPGNANVPGGVPYPAPTYPQYGAQPQYPAPQYPMPPAMPGAQPPAAPTYPQQPAGGGMMFPGMAPPPTPPKTPSNVPSPPPPRTSTNMPGAPRPLPAPPATATPPAVPPKPPARGGNVPPPAPSAPQQPAAPPKSAPGPKAAPKPILAPKPMPVPSSTSQHDAMPGAAPPRIGAPEGVPTVGAGPRVAADDEEEELDTATQLKQSLKKHGTPMGVSFVVHLLLIIALGLIAMPKIKNSGITLQASINPNPGENLADVRSFGSPDVGRPLEIDAQDQPLFKPTAKVAVNVPVSPFGTGMVVNVTSTIDGPPALAGRGMKGTLLGQYGGGQGTEDAVGLALQWLAKHQLADGMWSLTGEDKGNKARYSKGSLYENNEAATAMALMAFLGAGQTHKSGEYIKTVDKAVQALIRLQDPQGNFFKGARADDALYSQAQCTIAFCELYAMTKDEALKDACDKAVKYIVAAQDLDPVKGGGWRYRPRSDSDTSVTGWMVMALHSAKNAGFDVPQECLDRVSSYLDKAARGTQMLDPGLTTVTPDTPGMKRASEFGDKYAYQPGMDFDRVMTAEGLLCRMYLGWSQDDPRLKRGCDLLLDHLPQWRDRDVYFWYYATQTMFHMEGRHWKEWNGVLRDMLTERQEKIGPERGSWDPLDNEGPDLWSLNKHGGRLYVTCFSTFMLEVYYRHLPLYSDLKKQIEAKNKK